MGVFQRQLFPLNSTRRLRADVIHHSVHPFNLVNYPVGYPAKKLIWKFHPVRCHPVHARHSPESNNIFIRPLITHHSYSLDRKKHCKGLPYFFIKPLSLDLLHNYCVCLSQYTQSLFRNITQHPYCETWTRERLSPQNLIRNRKLFTKDPHLVLE